MALSRNVLLEVEPVLQTPRAFMPTESARGFRTRISFDFNRSSCTNRSGFPFPGSAGGWISSTNQFRLDDTWHDPI